MKIKRRGGGLVEYEYASTGEVHRISGSGAAPRRFQYDPRGLCTRMKTFQGGLDGAGPVLTSWNYDHHSGRLLSKQISGITVEDYDYTTAGRLATVSDGHCGAGYGYLPGSDLIYDHDSISNRLTAGRIDPATAAGEEQYTANDLNQGHSV